MLLIRMVFTLILFSLIGLQVISLRTSERNPSQFRNVSPWDQSRWGLISPTPDEYMEMHETACFGGRTNNTVRPMSRQELIEHYSSSDNGAVRRLAAKYKIDQECRREPTAWRFNYIDEDGKVLIRENSIDERSANILYMVRAVKPIIIDQFSYDWGDPRLDAQNMDLVAGPKFDVDLCSKQLNEMLTILEELSARASLLRNSSSSYPATPIELTDRHISMARILDSYGRYESGRLFGKIFSPGSYYQCHKNKLILGPEDRVGMRYCWAHLNYRAHLTESLQKRKRSKWEYPLDVLYAGMCIPETCHSKSFARNRDVLQKLLNSQFKNPGSTYIDEHMEMTSMFCVVDEDSGFGVPLAGKCLIAFIITWCLVTILVTIWNATIGKKSSQVWQEERRTSLATIGKRGDRVTILESLDLLESWRDFLTCYSRSPRRRPVNLDTLNFFKVYGCAFVVFGHTMALFGESSMDELRLTKLIENDWMCCLLLAGTLVVDTFFVITGILWAYFTLKRLNASRARRLARGHLKSNLSALQRTIDLQRYNSNDKREMEERKSFSPGYVADATTVPTTQDSDQQVVTIVPEESWYTTIKVFCRRWVAYSGFRYLRIVPLYVLVHWFKKYVFIYSGTGPYWDHGFNKRTPSGACRFETPLTPFTFLAAYYPISRQCTLQSWSIANDMFFAFLAPPIILLIDKRPKLALTLSLASGLLSYLFALDTMFSLPSHIDEELRELRTIGFYRFFDELSLLYTAPHYRMFNFLAGVWAGYALYHKQNSINLRLSHQQQQQSTNDDTNQQPTTDSQVCVEVSSPNNKEKVISDQIVWPSWFRGIATKLSFAYMILLFLCFGLNENFKLYSYGYYRWVYPQFVTSLRVFWSLSNAVIFLRMMTDWKDTLIMRWSAGKFWQIFSKLNYAILLIHLDMLMYTMYVSHSLATSFTKWSFFNMGAGIFMLCLPFSVFVYVMFENPFDKLVRSRLPRD